MGRYSASLTKGSLKVSESRIVAGLLLDGVEGAAWRKAILEDNVLQKRSPSSASTTAEMIARRLQTMSEPLWLLVRDGSPTVATQASLAAAIKHNPLIGDFLDIAVREQLRQFKSQLSPVVWSQFVQDYLMPDPVASTWTPAVLDKLRQNLMRILAEAGYISDTKTLRIERVTLTPELCRYLDEHGEEYVLRCLWVAA
ncbi:DUF1819 family protein [Armatimonas sp.]|uniref:DUF1819 family protein n=1 Tax=Armatimonas sp. TaxID=1872638 RepID=UPI0037503906